MEIDLLELRAVTLRLLNHVIDTRGVTKIIVDKNFYWKVPVDTAFQTDTMPTQLDVGSFADDWEFVSSLLKPDASPVAYQLTELAPLLAHVGEKLAVELAGKGG